MNLMTQLQQLIREGRLAHAYVIQGDPLTDGKSFANDLLVSLFVETAKESETRARHRIETRIHPDVFWVEPASKLRQIVKESMTAALKRISEKSFEGGWKAVVFLGAERMNPTVGNQLLKTLEEPPANTLLLLVTDTPEQLLNTLRSRCQTLIAPRGPQPPPPWLDSLLILLREGPPRNLLERLVRAARFRDFFQEVAQQKVSDDAAEEETDESGESEEVDAAVQNARETAARRMVNRQIMSAVEDWYRDLLVVKCDGDSPVLRYPQAREDLLRQAADLRPGDILKLLENTRDIARRLETNLPVQVVMESAVM